VQKSNIAQRSASGTSCQLEQPAASPVQCHQPMARRVITMFSHRDRGVRANHTASFHRGRQDARSGNCARRRLAAVRQAPAIQSGGGAGHRAGRAGVEVTIGVIDSPSNGRRWRRRRRDRRAALAAALALDLEMAPRNLPRVGE
jgi:hypothetical protein